jgi:hypothetical protein
MHGLGMAASLIPPDPGLGSIDLYWLPLGAGGHSVRWNGKIFEALVARHERRPACDLYHAALEVRSGGVRYVIEMAPVWNDPSPGRGVVCVGSVGARWLGRFRAFRYEVRCWPGGRIPDALEAVDSPRRLGVDPQVAARLLRLVPHVPSFTWGRDELGAGEMWNSNSLVAWLLDRSGHDMSAISPPNHGRAPGWQAGLHLAGGPPCPHRQADSPVIQGRSRAVVERQVPEGNGRILRRYPLDGVAQRPAAAAAGGAAGFVPPGRNADAAPGDARGEDPVARAPMALLRGQRPRRP